MEGMGSDVGSSALYRRGVDIMHLELLDPNTNLGWRIETLVEKDMLPDVLGFGSSASSGIDHTSLQMKVIGKC